MTRKKKSSGVKMARGTEKASKVERSSRLDRRADCLAFFAEAGRRGPAAPWILKPVGSVRARRQC